MLRFAARGSALLGLLSAACTADGAGTHVFVKDPHQVWVEATLQGGEEVVLPPGETPRSVRFSPVSASGEGRRGASYATLFREPSGSITVDDRSCAPWPTSPLSARGELRVMKAAGEAPFVSDGPTVRVPYLCEASHHRKVELDFVTPWSNVQEVRVVSGEVPVMAEPSTHPALQREDWRE